MIASASLNRILTKQPAAQDFLPPVSHHLSEHVVHFEDGRMGFVIRFDGIAHDSMEDNHLVNYFTMLKNVFAIAGKKHGNRLGLWTTMQRQRISLDREYRFKEKFCTEFVRHYMAGFNRANYYENLFYISGCLKYDDFDDGLSDAEELVDMLATALRPYDPHPLGTYTNAHGLLCSEVYQFLGNLINGGERRDIPLTAAAAYQVIGAADLFFGTDSMEIRTEQQQKFARCYDLKEFGQSKVKILINTLSLPCEFTLTQSFVYTNAAEIQSGINKQLNALQSAGDQAVDQHDELRLGKGEITAGRMLFGEYAAALVVYGASPKQARNNGMMVSSEFLTSGSFFFNAAGLAAPATFFSQWPGYKDRPRMMPKTTTNLATVFGMHTQSQGKSWGNPIGDGSPLMPLKTTTNTLFNLNLHYSKLDEDSLGQKMAGHTLILGATGTGKTTTETAILTFLMRFAPYLFVLDLDRGVEIFVRAVGGSYFHMAEGEDSGLNPFQLPDNGANRMFLYNLVKMCAGGANAAEEKQIKLAVDTLFNLQFGERRFSRLLESLPFGMETNSLRTRLSKWCDSEGGQYAWCLDSEQNRFDPDSFYRIGLDVTCILKKDYEPTGPVLAYLFHLKNMMADRVREEGSILASVIAEFWYAGMFPVTQDLMLKGLKTGRKEAEFMILDSQSPEDAINSPNFAAIVQQTPTKLFLPNPDAVFKSYEQCGLTRKEFKSLTELALESRTFLVKQSKQSAFVKLDLAGFDEEMAVLSGTTENVVILQQVMAEIGSENPDDWYRPFVERVAARIAAKRQAKQQE